MHSTCPRVYRSWTCKWSSWRCSLGRLRGRVRVKQSQSLELRDISHTFGTTPAVEHVALSLRAGELVALLGPSGCGKSTLLRIVAGFIRQTSGQVLFDGKPVDRIPANRRGVGIVFQNYALFPHLTVSENISYGLKAQGLARETRTRRVREML